MSGGLTNWIDDAKDRVGWYTSDWVARRRKCVKCGLTQKTVELVLEDLDEIIKFRGSSGKR